MDILSKNVDKSDIISVLTKWVLPKRNLLGVGALTPTLNPITTAEKEYNYHPDSHSFFNN